MLYASYVRIHIHVFGLISGNSVAIFKEMVAHSAYDMFCLYTNL